MYMRLLVLAVMLVAPLRPLWGQDDQPFRKVISLSAGQLATLSVALGEFNKYGLDSTKYRATLYAEGPNSVVIFDDPETGSPVFGSVSDIPTFEVELDSRNKVIEAHFAR